MVSGGEKKKKRELLNDFFNLLAWETRERASVGKSCCAFLFLFLPPLYLCNEVSFPLFLPFLCLKL